MKDGSVLDLCNPSDMPDINKINFMEEPWITASIMAPGDYIGQIINICNEKRGHQVDLTYTDNKALLIYKLPRQFHRRPI